MPFDKSTNKAFKEAMDEIFALTMLAETEEEADRWDKVADELVAARKKVIQDDFASRTFAYNFILLRLGAVCNELTKDPYRDFKRRLQSKLLEFRSRLMDSAVDVLDQFHNLTVPDEFDTETEDPEALEPHQSAKTDEPDNDQDIPAAEVMADAAEMTTTAPSQVRPDLHTEYESLFSTGVIRPDKLGSVNWHIGKLKTFREDYEATGTPLGIPWWFVGIIHCMECGFNFEGHLHNGDPLDAKTVHVPKGRPLSDNWDWASSARDALTMKGFDSWNEWSTAGALYQWERYNGFGYRKFHPETKSPYLWSFSNHYTKGKYVADGDWSATHVSKQCGAATLLRAMVNRGLVAL
jgi:lysozyme family protein